MRQVLNPDSGKFHVLHENISDESSYVILTEIQTIDRSLNETLLATESCSDGNCKQSDLVSSSFLRGGGGSADWLTTLLVCVIRNATF
jgi:hypothetical protein